jgi:hypothetical protein
MRRIFLTAALLGLLAGCGNGGLPLNGTVTRGGQPLQGTIAFEPDSASGTTGAGAVTTIRDGKFAVSPERQIRPGKYVVRVSPVPLGSGMDLKTAPPQFPPWETKMEITSAEPIAIDVPMKK